MLSSKVILVSGAGGLLGQQIVREIVGQNGCVLATDTDTDKAKSLFFGMGPYGPRPYGPKMVVTKIK